jgi:hypothetical protein
MAPTRKAPASHLAAILTTHPNPPREVQLTPLAIGILQQSSTKVLTGLGLIFTTIGAGALLFDSSIPRSGSWTMAFIMLFGTFLFLAPCIPTLKIHGALSQGHLGIAKVLRVAYSKAGTTDTLDSIQKGMARGTWQISQPTLLFEEPFETDEPWASALQPGSLVYVLIDTKRKCVLLPLGPI